MVELTQQAFDRISELAKNAIKERDVARDAVKSAQKLLEDLINLVSDKVYAYEELKQDGSYVELANALDEKMYNGIFASYRMEFEEALAFRAEESER